MIEETGLVIEANDNIAVIKVDKKEACGSCAAKSICHPFGEEDECVEIMAKNSVNAKCGDRVKLAIHEAIFLKASFITYLIPVIFLLAGSFAGEILFHNDIFNFLIGGIAFIISFFIIHSYSKKRQEKYLPEIIEII